MSEPVQNCITTPFEFFPLSKCIPYEPWCGTAGSPAFTPKAVLKAQTERKVSQWENKLKENTEAQVWEVCLFSPARHAPRKGAGGWEFVNCPPQRPGSMTRLQGNP